MIEDRPARASGDARLHRRLIDSLYVEAMVLADEARGYFEDAGRAERDLLDPLARVSYSCESLKVTTRLMHVIAWLLTQRAVEAGEITPAEAGSPNRRLGPAPVSDAEVLARLPSEARALVDSSADLYRRVARLDAQNDAAYVPVSPAKTLIERLQLAF